MMSSCNPPRASPGVITAFFFPANSIDSLLPTIGIQISGPPFCTGRGHNATSL